MPEVDDQEQEQTLNLLSPEMTAPVSLEITLGEAMLIRNLMETGLNARGYQMVDFCHRLMTKFVEATEGIVESLPVSESDE